MFRCKIKQERSALCYHLYIYKANSNNVAYFDDTYFENSNTIAISVVRQ